MDAPGAVEGRGLRTKTKEPSTCSTSHHIPVFKPKESLSHENLRLRAIFDRLDTLELNPHSQEVQNLRSLSLPLTTPNTRCSCGNVNQLSTSRSHHWGTSCGTSSGPVTRTMSRDSDLGPSSDDDNDEPFSLVSMVALLVAEERKRSTKKHGVLKNLAASCRGDAVSEKHLHQLVRLTGSDIHQISQAAFLALRQAGTNKANAEMLLQMSIVPQLLSLLQDKMKASSHALVAAVLEQIVVHRKLADYWLEKMITQGLSILIGSLFHTQELETKSAIGQLLSNLACYFEIAVLLLDHCMEDLMETWSKYPQMKACFTRLFTHLVQHNDHTIAGVLEHQVMKLVATSLKEDNCCSQISAADFFLTLCESSYGLSAFLDEGKAKVLLQVLRATHCRRLRKLCVATLKSIIQRANHNQFRDLTLQTEFAFNENSTSMSPDKVLISRSCEAAGKEDAIRRSRRGITILINILVETIHKDAKITLDNATKTQTVKFRPGVDLFKTMSDAVCCLCRMAVMPTSSHRRGKTQNLKSIEGPKHNNYRLNIDIIQAMFHQGALCVIHLLNTYTRHLFPVSGEQDALQHQRNIDVLHLQAVMKVWQMKMPPILGNPLPGEEELKFIQQLVECVGLFAECSSELWNQEIENGVKSDIQKHQGWTGDLKTAATSSSHDCYVKTIDQAFPTRVKIDNSSTKRQKDETLGERQMSSSEQRKMAWGDKKNLGASGEEACHPSSNILSGASSRNLHTTSIKKRNICLERFSESISTEKARVATSTKPKEPSMVKKDLRTAGYVRRPQNNVKLEGKVESAIRDEKQEIQKKLRTKLFQEDVCGTVGPWLTCTVPQIQFLAVQCLRCVIQPIHTDEIHQLRELAEAEERKNRHKPGSEMAKVLAERDKILSQVIGQMSTHTAGVMKDALGVKDQNERESKKSNKGNKVGTKPPLKLANHKPSLHSDKPIGWQCAIHLLEVCGEQILTGLSTDIADVRTMLLLLYDLVAFGETVIHMKLASLGAVSSLMDFLRQNGHKHNIALLALATLRNLTADYRLKQIFSNEQGEDFLNSLIKTSEGALRMHLQQFLEHITEGPPGSIW